MVYSLVMNDPCGIPAFKIVLHLFQALLWCTKSNIGNPSHEVVKPVYIAEQQEDGGETFSGSHQNFETDKQRKHSHLSPSRSG